MGFFSFMTADTKKSITNVHARSGALPVAVLIPEEYGGGIIEERSYDGYGRFGGRDVFELIAEWNYQHIDVSALKKPLREDFQDGERGQMYYEGAMAQHDLICSILEDYKKGLKPRKMSCEYGEDWKRILGIHLVNESRNCLKYDLKIVEINGKNLVYEEIEGISTDADDQGYVR